jgi:hypothetical protein
MIHGARFVFVLIPFVAASACKKSAETDPTATASASATEAEAAPTGNDSALLDACELKMTAPEVHEWKTKWNGAHVQTSGAYPSGVRSSHWADEKELALAKESGTVVALAVTCGSGDDADPTIIVKIEQAGSGLAEVPLAPGSYPIVANPGPGKGKPGEFTAHPLLFGKAMFTGKSGTLKIDRFDAEGASGSFVVDGAEMLTGSRPVHVEGTFHMPCRKGLLQSACKSDKAEQPK